MHFLRISEGESVIRIRERGLGCDLDIFWRGSRRDITLLAGAIQIVRSGLPGREIK